MKRRSFLEKSTFAALSPFAFTERPDEISLRKKNVKVKRSLRIVHFTDIHIEPGPSAKEVSSALHKINDMHDKPQLLFVGGDVVFDALSRNKFQVKEQWQLWQSVIKNENSVPMVSCIGNHDIWGWVVNGDIEMTQDTLYGKQWAIEELKMPNRYYSFNHSNWHFIIVDSMLKNEHGKIMPRLDFEQLEWLKEDLTKVPADIPVCVMSHVPILSVCYNLMGESFIKNDRDNIDLLGLTHLDSRTFRSLFSNHSNVKLCISGHLHLQEKIEFQGVKYLCNGAVCGNWWQGKSAHSAPGYAIIDLYTDGTSDHEWIYY